MSFVQRAMRFTFSGEPSGTFSAAGLRAVVNMQAAGGRLGVWGRAKIWGLSMSQMNAYSTAIPGAIGGNGLSPVTLLIEAGEVGGSFSRVFVGLIWSSYIDLSGAPDSAFIVSIVDIYRSANPTGPQSLASAQNAEDLIASICAGAGLTLNNNGAHAVLRNSSTYGSAVDQIDTIARAASFRWILNGTKVSIWPQNGSIDDVVVDLGPTTNPRMVGYPGYWEAGPIVTSLYNPEIQVGRNMNVTGSSIPKSNGLWRIVGVQHNLSTMLNKGPWFTTAQLSGIGI